MRYQCAPSRKYLCAREKESKRRAGKRGHIGYQYLLYLVAFFSFQFFSFYVLSSVTLFLCLLVERADARGLQVFAGSFSSVY
jgi:hypothetical protein